MRIMSQWDRESVETLEVNFNQVNLLPNPRIRLSVCVCVRHQKTPSNTLSTAAPKLDSG